jgi:hypothetical protein
MKRVCLSTLLDNNHNRTSIFSRLFLNNHCRQFRYSRIKFFGNYAVSLNNNCYPYTELEANDWILAIRKQDLLYNKIINKKGDGWFKFIVLFC